MRHGGWATELGPIQTAHQTHTEIKIQYNHWVKSMFWCHIDVMMTLLLRYVWCCGRQHGVYASIWRIKSKLFVQRSVEVNNKENTKSSTLLAPCESTSERIHASREKLIFNKIFYNFTHRSQSGTDFTSMVGYQDCSSKKWPPAGMPCLVVCFTSVIQFKQSNIRSIRRLRYMTWVFVILFHVW